MEIKKYLGGLKARVKTNFLLFIRVNSLRLQGCTILENVFIAKDIKVYPSNKIGRNSRLSNVILSEGVEIGNNSAISNIKIGENTIIDSWVGCTGFGNGKIEIGKESYIGLMNILDYSNDISIGDFVHIAGPSTGLWTHSSAAMSLNGIPIKQKGMEVRPTGSIKVESNVYIGGNCTIYPGVSIGHHSVITPNSAVTKDVLPYTMVGGVPAKFIKKIELP